MQFDFLKLKSTISEKATKKVAQAVSKVAPVVKKEVKKSTDEVFFKIVGGTAVVLCAAAYFASTGRTIDAKTVYSGSELLFDNFRTINISYYETNVVNNYK